MRRPWRRRVYHLPIRPRRPTPAGGISRRAGRGAVHRPCARRGARPQVPEPTTGGATSRRPRRQRDRRQWRPLRPRRGHLGTDELHPPTGARLRSGRADCRLRRQTTRSAVAAAHRTMWRRPHPDGSLTPRTPRRSVVPRSSRSGGRHVLVVDDVVTTGATLRSARAALAGAGAADVRLYAVASTPTGVAAASRPAHRHLQAVTTEVAA